MIEATQQRMDVAPQSPTKLRRRSVEHPFGTIKAWMGHTQFLMKRFSNMKTEISLPILTPNLKRVMQILGTGPIIAAIRT